MLSARFRDLQKQRDEVLPKITAQRTLLTSLAERVISLHAQSNYEIVPKALLAQLGGEIRAIAASLPPLGDTLHRLHEEIHLLRSQNDAFKAGYQTYLQEVRSCE